MTPRDPVRPPSLAQPVVSLPRRLATRFGIGVLQALCRLPIPWVLALGEGLGRALTPFLKSRRRVVRINLATALPHLLPTALDRAVADHFAASGRGLFEACLAWWATPERLAGRLEVEGLEHWHAAREGQKGVLLLTGHFTTMEMASRALCEVGIAFHPLYRPIQDPAIDAAVRGWREMRSRRAAIPKTDLKTLLRVLRAGEAVWYGPDQTLDTAGSVFVPFFGRPALALTATGKLAELGRARVLPYFPRYLGRGRWKVTILSALDDFPSSDELADAARVTRLLEDAVRAAPLEYFWLHRKYKFQPPGIEPPY